MTIDAADLRDVSLREAARITHRSPSTLSAIWEQIPTAYRTEGGRCWVTLAGLREWQQQRSMRVASPEGSRGDLASPDSPQGGATAAEDVRNRSSGLASSAVGGIQSNE